MRKPLPPLSSLRSFEAVARQLSFSNAAEELHVTPGAVSQQIRALEELLGTKLFDRTRRSVSLSDAGARMLPDIQAGLEMLSRAVSSKTTSFGERTLTISAAPSFASKWLLPRLPRFHEQHPDLDLRISATVGLADFRRERVDLAIRLGHGNYPGLHAEPLFSEALTRYARLGSSSAKAPSRGPMTFASIASFTIRPSPAVNRTPGNDGWHSRAPSTYLPSVAPDLRWPSSPCRLRLTVPASCLGGSCWPRRIWRRAAWSAHSRPCCPWMSAISSLGRKWPLLDQSFAIFATGCSVRYKARPTPTELRKPFEWRRTAAERRLRTAIGLAKPADRIRSRRHDLYHAQTA